MSTATPTAHRAADVLYDRIAAVYDQTRQLPSWVPAEADTRDIPA